ncbi:MAG: hypothetical protein JWL84_4076 [Rhodospirillales bacterium]|jgi:hypothetical protein|nr:hypothetical protein [Rhodospirillales bacterium]
MAAPLVTGGRVMAEPAVTDRARRIRAKNRALLIVLVGLVALFYAIAMARMGG